MDKKETKKKKIDSAKKRQKQSAERRLRNRAYRSRIKTSIKDFEQCSAGEKSKKMGVIYSLVDKYVQKGILSKNKGNRLKRRAALKS